MGGQGRLSGTFAAALVTVLLAAGPATAAPGAGVYNEPGKCVRTDSSSTLVPPAAEGQSFELRRRPGVSAGVGAQIQNDLISHNVQANLAAGLGSNPLGFPGRPVPIFLVPGQFDQDGDEGITAKTCSDSSVQAIVARTDDPPLERASTAAHELFHAYSAGVPPTTGRPKRKWWEEAAASWSEQKNGFNEPVQFDDPMINLPEYRLDRVDKDHEYAMWRFVQFLDDRGYFGPAGGTWFLHREVIAGYGAVNQALQSALASRGTSLAAELAAFWGDRLKAQPMHGPSLKPTSARTVKIEPGTTTVVPKAGPLRTWYRTYEVGNNVKRVTFHFEPNEVAAEGGRTWAAPSASESRRVLADETISFCVGVDNGADLVWPTRGFPITFTNGNLAGDAISTEIEITAQKESVQCGSPPPNPACKLLVRAPISEVFGAGFFPFYSAGDGIWRCVFVNNSEQQEVDLLLRKEPRSTPINQLRRRFRQALAESGFREIAPGDVAGVHTEVLEETTVSSILMLVGRKVIFLSVYHTSEGKAIEAARVVAAVA